jgi:sporulation and spore germination protein
VRARALLVLAAASLALAGCTLVPTGSSPGRVERSDVPFGLLDPTIPATNGGRVVFVTQPVYVVDATGQHLAPSSRIVPSPPTLASVLKELLLGPTSIEAFAGYTSALPKGLVLLAATTKRGVGTIALSKPLSSLPHEQEVLAVGQLALTAHAVGATNGVEVTVGGVPETLPLPSGKTVTRVTAADEAALLNP